MFWPSIYLFCLLCELTTGQIEKSSLTFVIDDTASMGDDIEGVKLSVNLVFDMVYKSHASQIENFVIVTFNDPDVKFWTVTKKEEVFKRELASIQVHGGDDCEEMSMAGIELALRKSLPGSYIYVYTDASAKDSYLIERVQNLAIEKKSQIVFLLTGMCIDDPDDPQYKVYHTLARATSGQVFHMKKSNVGEILKYIAETVRNRKTVVVADNFAPGYGHEFSIPVDGAMKEVMVAVSGTDSKLDLTAPDGSKPEVDRIVDLSDVIVDRIADTMPGNYTGTVGGTTGTRVVVTAATSIDFKYGFSGIKPTCIEDTATRPIEGERTYLSIQLETTEDSITLNTVQLLDMDKNVVFDLPVTLIDDKKKLYWTKYILPPSYLFNVVINGFDAKSNSSFKRFSPTPVEPQKPASPTNMKPAVIVPSGFKVTAEYNKTLKLSCKVSGYPKPVILWTDEAGNKLRYLESIVELPYDYIAILDIDKVTKNATYLCQAKNVYGEASANVAIEIAKLEYFKVLNIPKDISIEYNNTGSVVCEVSAEPPAAITWYGNGKKLHTDTNVEISPDGSILTVKNMKKYLSGPYICEARNSNKRKLFYFHMFITKFVQPKIIKDSSNIVHALKGTDAELSCRTSQGEPTPQVSWYSNKFDMKNYSSEVIRLKNVQSEDSGTYMCIAQNDAGFDNHEIELEVEYAPSIKKELSRVTAKQGARITLRCDAKGSPPPKVEWHQNGERIFNDRTYHVYRDHSLRFKASPERAGIFICTASNSYGSVNQSTQVDFAVPVMIDPPEESMFEKKAGEGLTLHCVADGFPRPNIKWLFYGSESKIPRLVSRSPTLVIKNLQAREDGNFVCVASNDYSSMNITYTVKVLASPVIDSELENVYKAVLGDVVLRIPCKASGIPKPEITWLKNRLSITTGTNFEIEADGTLLIKNVRVASGGTYLCVAENKVGRAIKPNHVTVLPYPMVSSPAKTVYIEEGSTFDLPCEVPYAWTDSLKWYKDHLKLNSSKLENVAASDAGDYVCHVSTLSDSSSTGVRVVVGTKPVFTNNEPELEMDYVKYSKAYLDCETYSHPAPNVTWMHDSKTLNNTDDINEFEMDFDSMGTYTCIVTNGFGSIYRTFSILNKDCLLNLREDFGAYQPIMTESSLLHLPRFETSNEHLKIPFAEKVTLHCPNGRFINFPTDKVPVTCDGRNIFNIAERRYRYSDFKCYDEVEPALIKTGLQCSADNSELVEIGFEIAENFIKVYEICLDKETNTPVYTKQKLQRNLAGVEPVDVNWIEDDLDLEEAYDCTRETYEISTRLRKWFHTDDRCCFKKRLLVNPRDLLGGIYQNAAFLSFNVVPQWSTCNSENWDAMEQRVRHLAKESIEDLVVWTGTAGQLRLPNDTGTLQDIILNDESGNEQLVPLYLWKVIQTPESKSSLAIVQINVPDVKIVEARRYMFCRDICHDIPWLSGVSWQDTTNGFTFCCRLEDFEKALGYKDRFGIGNTNVLYENFLIPEHSLT